MRRARLLAVSAIVAIMAQPAPSSAQTASPVASVFLPVDHWSVAAARRLADLGVAPPGFGWSSRALPIEEVRAVFRAAVAGPRGRLAAAYLARFEEELGPPRAAAGIDAGVAIARVIAADGALRPGSGYGDTLHPWTGPRAAAAPEGAMASLRAIGRLGRRVAASATLTAGADAPILEEAQLVAVAGGVGAWIGRRTVGYGSAHGGDLLLAGAAMDALGVFLPGAPRLPLLGAIRLETALARPDANGRIREPWFWTLHVSAEPHPRFQLAATRAAVFGGAGTTDFTFTDFLKLLATVHTGSGSENSNQIGGVEARFRPPLGAIPAVLTVAWAAEDNAGALFDSPGLIARFELPAVPGAEAFSASVERTHLGRACCGNPHWYRHFEYEEGWTLEGVPLGHPLGGEGDEWLVRIGADLDEARLRLDARGFARERGAANTFAPDRAGSSRGGGLRAAWRVAPRVELTGAVTHERGASGWTETHARAGVGLRW